MKTGYTILRAAKPMVCDREDGSVDWPEDPGYDKQRGRFLVTDMLVDEEGVLKQLPVNMAATALYSQQAIVNNYRGRLSPICGTAIVFHRPVFF